LIPEDKLNEKLKEEWVKESLDPIPELAEEFQVSENFMRKRLKLSGSSNNQGMGAKIEIQNLPEKLRRKSLL
jgi:Zn-dependent peptidase ImmA (M78 family)